MSVPRGALAGRGRIRLRAELSLPELPAHHRIGVQAIRGRGAAKFGVTRGSDKLMIFGDDRAHDAHRARCGSLLYSVVRDGAFVHVAMGTLTDDPSIRPTAHIFVGSKAPWFEIADGLPQHVGHVTQREPGGQIDRK